MENFIKLEEDLKALEKKMLTPEGYELYDFGGNNMIAPTTFLGIDGKIQNVEGTKLPNMIAIYKQKEDKPFIFAMFELDPEKYDTKDLVDAFKKAIAEGK